TITNPPGAPVLGTSHIDIQFQNGDPVAGTTVYASFEGRYEDTVGVRFTLSYKFSASDIASGIGTALRNVMEDWRDNQGMGSITDIDDTNSAIGWFNSLHLITGVSARSYYTTQVNVLHPALSDDIISTPSLKSRTSYKLALAHYDAYGRPFPIVTQPNLEI